MLNVLKFKVVSVDTPAEVMTLEELSQVFKSMVAEVVEPFAKTRAHSFSYGYNGHNPKETIEFEHTIYLPNDSYKDKFIKSEFKKISEDFNFFVYPAKDGERRIMNVSIRPDALYKSIYKLDDATVTIK